MGYAVYECNGRWQGYGVPATCDEPTCEAKIDRGLAYICGNGPVSDEGCGLFFCGDHLYVGLDEPQMCQRCCDDEPPYEPKPDHPEWINHMNTDPSWAQWRSENLESENK